MNLDDIDSLEQDDIYLYLGNDHWVKKDQVAALIHVTLDPRLEHEPGAYRSFVVLNSGKEIPSTYPARYLWRELKRRI